MSAHNERRQLAKPTRSCGQKPLWGFCCYATPQCEHRPLQSQVGCGLHHLRLLLLVVLVLLLVRLVLLCWVRFVVFWVLSLVRLVELFV